jgi:hypothetical protein
MTKKWLVLITFTLCGLILLGSKFLISSPEEKINSAFPLSQNLILIKDDALLKVPDKNKEIIKNEFSNKLKLRAITCSKGYTPAWYETSSKIRLNVQNNACFKDNEEEIEKWLGLIRVGVMLAEPPLKSIPTNLPKFFVAESFVESANFAKNAGVALLQSHDKIQILDMSNGGVIFQESKNKNSSRAILGSLSPNGRLFYSINNQESLSIRSSEDGEVIATLPVNYFLNFSWLDDKIGIYRTEDSSKILLIDFLSGRQEVLKGITDFTSAFPVEGTKNQYFIVGMRAVSKIEVNWQNQTVDTQLLAEYKPKSGLFLFSIGASGTTSDGANLFSTFGKLTLNSTSSLLPKEIEFKPFLLQGGFATSNPDELVLFGVMESNFRPNSSRTEHYLYSISKSTLTPIDISRLSSERFIYIPSIKKLGAISESKIEILNELPLGSPVAVSKFVADAATEQSLYKLQLIEKQQAYAQGVEYNSSVASNAQSNVGSALEPAPFAPSSKPTTSQGVRYNASIERRQPEPILTSPAPFAAIAKDAQIEAVGVYQATGGRTSDKKAATIKINVRRSAKPLVLVLTAYEPIRWEINLEPGAKIATILQGGYEESQVIGGGSSRVTNIGRLYSYEAKGSNYDILDSEVFRMTGRHIGVFQGRYEGSAFSVGGT